MTGQVIRIADYQAAKQAVLADYPPLECPRCDTLCPPTKVDHEGSVHHRCAGNGHRAITWRIALDGSMLRGAVGRAELKV